MKGVILRRARARQDLVAIYRHYSREAGMGIAERFLATAEAAFRRVAAIPGSGARYPSEVRAFGELRFTPLPSRFKKYLVFYRPVEGGVEIIRVLHGARDLPGILAEELGGADEDEE